MVARAPTHPRLRKLLRYLGIIALLLGLLGLLGASVVLYFLAPELKTWRASVEALHQKPLGQCKFHSRLYSAATPLTPGMVTDLNILVSGLEARKYERVKTSTLRPGQYRLLRSTLEVFLRGYALEGASGPSGHLLLELGNNRLEKITPLEGTSALQTFAIEPLLLGELLGDPPLRATYVPLEAIPQRLIDIIVAAEDSRFRSHHGIDPRGIARAAVRNLKAREVVEGGSTLTQQLARAFFLERSRTWKRKLSELAIALQMDRIFSKDEQLELYLNSVYLGQADGVAIHGVAEAARAYFDQPLEALTLAQMALVAAIVPAPSAYSPSRFPEKALTRRNRVLDQLLEQGIINVSEAEVARREPLALHPGKTVTLSYGYFSGYVRHRLTELLGAGYEKRGLTIHSSMDPFLQTQAEKLLKREVKTLERFFGNRPEPLQGALFLMEVHTGKVLAVVGGKDYQDGPYNRAFQASRQPGSAFKGIVYAAALEGVEGQEAFTPATTISNQRRTFQVKEGDWKPRNYEAEYHEKVTLAKALALSLNVAAVNLIDTVGPSRVVSLGEKLGMKGLRPVLSLGLGTSEVTLERLTAAYASFPAGGVRVEPVPVERIMDATGQLEFRSELPLGRVFSPQTAAMMVDMLKGVVIWGTAWRLRSEGWFQKPVAGKTGTTQDEQDAWFIGFTPDLIMGVWFGYDAPQHMYGSAADIAVPAWGRIMSDLTRKSPPKDFPPYPGLEAVLIDPYSGGLATARCPRPMKVMVPLGAAPKFRCTLSHDIIEPELEAPQLPVPLPEESPDLEAPADDGN